MVALSSTKAKFVIATKVAKEAMSIKGVLNELQLNQETIQDLCDNQSATQLIKNQVYHQQSKHIDVKLQFIKDEVVRGSCGCVQDPYRCKSC